MTLIAAGELSDGATIETDLCIIGAGAAGITIARELAGSGLSIAMLAGGGETFRHAPQRLYHGRNVGRESFAPGRSRLAHVRRQHHPLVGPVPAAGSHRLRGAAGTALHRLAVRAGSPGAVLPACRRRLPSRRLAFRAALDRPRRRGAAGRRGAGPLPPWLADRLRRRLPAASCTRPPTSGCSWTFMPSSWSPRAAGWPKWSARTEDRRRARFVAGSLRARLRRDRERPPAARVDTGRQRNGLGNEHDLVGRFFMDHPFYWGGELVLARPEYAAALEVLEGYEVAGRCQPTHGAFALTEAARRDRESERCRRLFRPPCRPTGRRPTFLSQGGIALGRVGDVLSAPRAPRRARRAATSAGSRAGPARRRGSLARARRRRSGRRGPRSPPGSPARRCPIRHSRVTLDPHRHDRFGMPHVAVDWQLGGTRPARPRTPARRS